MNKIDTSLLGLDITSPTSTTVTIIGGVLALAIIVLLVLSMRRAGQMRANHEMETARREAAAEARLTEMLRVQSEMQGRLAAMSEVFGNRQAELNQTISQRLDGMTHRIGATISEQTKSTHENLRRLQERLAVIDAAQNNIQSLAKDVVGLQAILSNKQTRGAFGQSRMETIVADGLPIGAYSFQPTLSNGYRPDCTIRMPNGAPPLVVDAKFRWKRGMPSGRQERPSSRKRPGSNSVGTSKCISAI